jgi:hypothetical protein
MAPGILPACACVVLPTPSRRRDPNAPANAVVPASPIEPSHTSLRADATAETASTLRLVSVHADIVKDLTLLRVPIQDLTPAGLGDSGYHILGLLAEQRKVLEAWNIELNDVTPDILETASELLPHLQKPAPPVRRPRPMAVRPRPTVVRRTSESEVAVPMTEEPKKHGDPLLRAAVDADPRIATRLRVSAGGKYREAVVKDGKILLDGVAYDSTTDALQALAVGERDWVFWELFDAETGKWRILEGEWHPTNAT